MSPTGPLLRQGPAECTSDKARWRRDLCVIEEFSLLSPAVMAKCASMMLGCVILVAAACSRSLPETTSQF